MSWFKNLCEAELKVACPQVFVETGTYQGDGIQRVLADFRQVYSIELKEEYAHAAAERFRGEPKVQVLQGDSAEVLASLATALAEPALFYLDAHYSGGETAFGKQEDNGCPLLRELEVLARRPHNDVVVIDDMRLMGKACYSGVPGDAVYPLTFFDFTHASQEAIHDAYAGAKQRRAGGQCQVDVVMCKDFDRLVFVCKGPGPGPGPESAAPAP